MMEQVLNTVPRRVASVNSTEETQDSGGNSKGHKLTPMSLQIKEWSKQEKGCYDRKELGHLY